MVDSKRICALEEAEVLAAHEAAIQLGIIEPMTKEEWYDREPKFRSRTIHRLVRYCSFYFDFGQTSITLGISCPQPAQSRCAALSTAARSKVVGPIAANPNIHSQPQSKTALATTVNQTGTPCVSGRAHAEKATHTDPSLNKWPSCPARLADSHLVAPCGAIAATSRTT